MHDLISRQAAIEAFKKELTIGESKGNYVTICSAVSYEGAKQILESLSSAQQWIPCSERLPEEEEEDFLVTDGESMAVGYYRQDARAWDSTDFGWIENKEKGYGINEVVAWMPLPEPYKGE